jgi:hypothetical protein
MILKHNSIQKFAFETLFWQLIANCVFLSVNIQITNAIIKKCTNFAYKKKWNIFMLNLFYNKLGCLKLEIYCKLKQYSVHTYCPVVKSVKKKKSQCILHSKAHFIEDTIHLVW